MTEPAGLLTDDELERLTAEELEGYVALLQARIAEVDPAAWRASARPEQMPPEGDWTTLFLRGGRGSGKSWAGAHILAELIADDPARATEGPGKWAILAPVFGDARDVAMEGESGFLAALGTSRAEIDAGRSKRVLRWNRSLGELDLRDGTKVIIDGAEDGGFRVQGSNLRGAWCDEIGLWKRFETAYDESLGYALRKGSAKRIVTGTPKRNMPARALVKRLLNDSTVVNRRLLTRDNLANLAPSFWQRVSTSAGTELGRQELEGELLEDVEGALWTRSWIEDHRVDKPFGRLTRTVVALDPSDGVATGDEQATVAVAMGLDRRLYVLESYGMRKTPLEWLRHALSRAQALEATIVIEKNHGGRALADLLGQAMAERGVRLPYQLIDARVGKLDRAQPVAMLYETGAVSHVGRHDELEEQLVTYTGAGKSPDRMDALVHGLRELAGIAGSALRSASWGDGAAVPYTDDLRSDGAAVAWDAGLDDARVWAEPTRQVIPYSGAWAS